MRDLYPKVTLGKLCRLLGVTRQAYYQHFWTQESTSFEDKLVVDQILRIREKHRHIGGRKLYECLKPFLLEHQIKMGRDRLFNVLAANYLLVRQRKRHVKTTNSFHRFKKYPNLIKGFIPNEPNQLWVSDVTYWKIDSGFVYISFITDAYSRKIVGYNLADNLNTSETIKALKMALMSLSRQPTKFKLIHHSDRGTQYCSGEYIKLLQDHHIDISMTESGDPLDNAIAERVNGIIKEEYLNDYDVNNINDARELLNEVILLYNNDRLHMSISNLTPNQAHRNNIKTKRLWKNYYVKSHIIVNE